MTPDLSKMAVMNLEKGEEIVGGWATPKIPQVGIYKLLAKQRRDGIIEWAHFVQRDNGQRDRVTRGEVESRAQLDEVLEIMNRNLRKVFGVTMQPAEYEMRTVDGKPAPPILH